MLDKIKKDYIDAYKSGNTIKKETLNYLLSQIKYEEKNLMRNLKEEEIYKVIKKEIKTLEETLIFLEKENRLDDINIVKEKINILNSYLPPKLDYNILINEIKNLKNNGMTNGEIIKNMLSKYPGRVDPKEINEILNSIN